MEALGHPLSWTTSCFIDGGCGAQSLFGHTNGHGDFVLLDRREPPWPVHECYLRRFELSGQATVLRIGRTRSFEIPLPVGWRRAWDEVRAVRAAPDDYWKEIDVVATVADTFDSLGEWRRELNNVYGPERAQMHDQVHRSRAVVRLVTGNGEEYVALYNPNQFDIRFKDLVATRLKVKPFLDEYAFFIVSAKHFRG